MSTFSILGSMTNSIILTKLYRAGFGEILGRTRVVDVARPACGK